MRFDLFFGAVHLGWAIRSASGGAFAYLPDGAPLGTFADLDAAALALARYQPVRAAA